MKFYYKDQEVKVLSTICGLVEIILPNNIRKWIGVDALVVVEPKN
jgi:hypothetical protein